VVRHLAIEAEPEEPAVGPRWVFRKRRGRLSLGSPSYAGVRLGDDPCCYKSIILRWGRIRRIQRIGLALIIAARRLRDFPT
jgi:hypothetical protein